ncbi:hypothetical protein DSO57_1013543 [Entomophthora muscae]|uniref:Uncharacterized protein n=1 Tax=Entomophthora muscae TaxID=34485 RepID=A0ACC2USR8_9FUNG|nr:hypothetical protein DSO57_1013543 [Entomophthora muscae]
MEEIASTKQTTVNNPTKGPATPPSPATQPRKASSSGSKASNKKEAAPTSIRDPANKPKNKGQPGKQRKNKKGAADEKTHTGDDPADGESDDLYEETEEEAAAEGKPKNLFEAVIAGAQKDGTELTEDSFAIDKEKILAKTNGKNETK